MPNTYVALATHTVTGSNLSGLTGITFTGIPQEYTDLRIVQNITVTNAAIGLVQINGNTTALYSVTSLAGNGTAASSDRSSNATSMSTRIAHTGTTIGTYISDYMNYSNTTTNKTVLFRNNNTGFGTEAVVGLFRSTSAITSIKLFLDRAESYVVGSTFNLYGIANADQGAAKATGGIITEDSQYWYHTFAASGTFTPKQALTCEALVVAGGGGGGFDIAGGGGAGGLLYSASQSLTAINYSVTVGAGGPAATSYPNNGTNGTNSVFNSLTAIGGGGGQGYESGSSGNSGGSGGGGSQASGGSAGTGGARTVGQGNIGGNGTVGGGSASGGGGGGADGAGGAGINGGAGGAGGVGSSAYSSWGSVTGAGQNVSGTVYYAGGGGGGQRNISTSAVGGLGGGGNGANSGNYNGTSGIANTGGGGGGSASGGVARSGAGGSGVVIIRYSK